MQSNRFELSALAAAVKAGDSIRRSVYTRDAALTFDRNTIDSAGAFLISELERLDQTMHEPLASVTWSRDIDLREDVSIADEMSSWTNSSFAAPGETSTGKSWIGKDSNVIASLALDIGKTAQPLLLWGRQIGWTIPELESSQKLGRPVDQQKLEALQLKYQMDVDEQVYIGDTTMGMYGLVNNPAVVVSNVANGASGTALWANKSPQEILADVNKLITATWAASAYSVCPDRILIPPVQFSLLVSSLISSAGNISTLEFLRMNSMSNSLNGRPLQILPLKWLVGRGVGGTDRFVAYSKEKRRVRFPLVPLQRTPIEYRDLRQLVTYFGRLGAVEMVYPETLAYADGL